MSKRTILTMSPGDLRFSFYRADKLVLYQSNSYKLLHRPHRRGTPPLPRPLSARCAVPGGALGPGLGCVRLEKNELLEYLAVGSRLTASLWGFRTVSSTEMIRHAASTALLIALVLIRLGSQTNASKLSRTPSGPSTSTPIHVSPRACLMRSLFKISVESRPALSQICRGIISSAFANAVCTS
jgi:hypothetical protein